MQEFRFGKKIKGCFRSFPTKNLTPMPANNNSLEGFFVWTTEGLYECRPKVILCGNMQLSYNIYTFYTFFIFLPNVESTRRNIL